MSAGAMALTAYLTLLSGSIQDDNSQRMALTETDLLVHFQETNIPFSHQRWRVIDKSVCADRDRNSSEYSNCTIKAKSLFNQLCSALTNSSSNYWHHQKYKEMYCDAAVNFKPMVATISYGNSTQISEQEKQCNRAILKALVDNTAENIANRNRLCEGIK